MSADPWELDEFDVPYVEHLAWEIATRVRDRLKARVTATPDPMLAEAMEVVRKAKAALLDGMTDMNHEAYALAMKDFDVAHRLLFRILAAYEGRSNSEGKPS